MTTCSKTFTLAVDAGCVITTPSPLPDAEAGVVYVVVFAETGAGGAPVWSVIAGALPPGVNLVGGGVIIGTPTATGDFNFTMQVVGTDHTCSKAFALHVGPHDCGANPASVQDAIWTPIAPNDGCHSFAIAAGIGAWNMTYETVPNGPCQTPLVAITADICNTGPAYNITVTIPWTDSGNIDPPPADDIVTFLLDINGVQDQVNRAATTGPFTDVVLTVPLPAFATSTVIIEVSVTVNPSPLLEVHGTVTVTPLTPP